MAFPRTPLPLLPLVCAWCVGLLVGDQLQALGLTLPWWPAVVGALPALLLIERVAQGQPRLRRGVRMLTTALLAATWLTTEGPPPSVHWPGQPQRWEGVLAQAPRPTQGGGLFTVVALAGAPEIHVALRVGRGEWQAEEGDHVQWEGRIRPYEAQDNPGEGDPAPRVRRLGLSGKAWVQDAAQLSWTRRAPPSLLSEARRRLLTFIQLESAPPETGVLAALLLGQTHLLDPELRRAWASSGLAHILSISGLHVTGLAVMVAGLVRWLLGHTALRASRWRRWLPALAGLALAGAYTALAGAPPPALRALVMGAVILVARASSYHSDPLAPLVLAAAALLVVEPSWLWDVGFELSFASLLSLTALTPVVTRHLPDAWQQQPPPGTARMPERLARGALSIAVASVAATAGTAPLLAYHFGTIPLVGPLANVAALTLLSTVATPLGLLACLVQLLGLPLVAAAMLKLCALCIAAGNTMAVFFGDPSIFPALRAALSGPAAVAAFVGVLAWAWAPGRKQRALGSAGAAALLVGQPLGCSSPEAAPAGGLLRLIQLNVGQGDGALIELPGGEVMVVDGGGAAGGADPGARVMVPALQQAGHPKVDVMVLSHPHPDHLGGLLAVARGFPVGELWIADPRAGGFADRLVRGTDGRWQGEEGDPLVQLVRAVEGSGGRITPLLGGQQTRLGEVQVEVIHPALGWPPPGPAAARSVNNGSLTLRMCWQGRCVLLTGDIEEEAEAHLVATGAALAAQVLKVPHHGSDTSSTAAFLEKVQPKVAVIGVGRSNRWRFPREEVLARLNGLGARVLRTDHGAARVDLSPAGLESFQFQTGRGWMSLDHPPPPPWQERVLAAWIELSAPWLDWGSWSAGAVRSR